MKGLTKIAILASVLAFGSGIGGASYAAVPVPITEMKHVKEVNVVESWDKVFEQNQDVAHEKVQFKNRYGVTLVGDLYMPKSVKEGDKLQAIAIAGPFGAVKEQVSGLYAQELASRGFVTLAFDPSYSGESTDGEVKNIVSSEIYTEDFSAAVDFLGIQSFVDRDEIGVLGICGLGGFALNNAAMDTRVKAVATSVMYDMPRVIQNGYNDSNKDSRESLLKVINEDRWSEAESGELKDGPRINPEPSENAPQFIKEYYDYYRTSRGYHERSVNSSGAFKQASMLSILNTKINEFSDSINPRAVLIVAGENAHSRYFSEDAYNALGDNKNKELYLVPDAVHVDLYDNTEKIPFHKFSEFFHNNLRK
ncbi:alpha/beta hydrolase [Veillonella agrestimuris]|uniref:alpha/beta hydrolase n=1 Tax=Veillonella agrestimuris TaxID=2941340 RepID=UPI002042207E|nr:alpha/beta hydrolase [Veillonella agrestimuris]